MAGAAKILVHIQVSTLYGADPRINSTCNRQQPRRLLLLGLRTTTLHCFFTRTEDSYALRLKCLRRPYHFQPAGDAEKF